MAKTTDLLAILAEPAGVIAFATDTVYGIGCRIDRPKAIEAIYRLKGRQHDKPLVLLGADAEAIAPFVSLPAPSRDQIYRWMTSYWPGALTLVLPKTDAVPNSVTRGKPTVAVRVPDCPPLQVLLRQVPGGVLATTSANRSGEPPCLTSAEILQVFPQGLQGIGGVLLADNPATQKASPMASTIVAVDDAGQVTVLRRGTLHLDL